MFGADVVGGQRRTVRPLPPSLLALALVSVLLCTADAQASPPPPAAVSPVYYPYSIDLSQSSSFQVGQGSTTNPVYQSGAVTILSGSSSNFNGLCLQQTFITNATCSTSNGFSLSFQYSVGPIPSGTYSIADGFAIAFLSPSDVPPSTCAIESWGQNNQYSQGVVVPKYNGLSLVTTLYGGSVGYSAAATTTGGWTGLATNMASGTAILTNYAVKNAFVTHTVDVYGGYLTWRIGGSVVLSGVSAASIPQTFFVAFMGNCGGGDVSAVPQRPRHVRLHRVPVPAATAQPAEPTRATAAATAADVAIPGVLCGHGQPVYPNNAERHPRVHRHQMSGACGGARLRHDWAPVRRHLLRLPGVQLCPVWARHPGAVHAAAVQPRPGRFVDKPGVEALRASSHELVPHGLLQRQPIVHLV